MSRDLRSVVLLGHDIGRLSDSEMFTSLRTVLPFKSLSLLPALSQSTTQLVWIIRGEWSVPGSLAKRVPVIVVFVTLGGFSILGALLAAQIVSGLPESSLRGSWLGINRCSLRERKDLIRLRLLGGFSVSVLP